MKQAMNQRHSSSNNLLWLIAGLIAVLAVVMVGIFGCGPRPDPPDPRPTATTTATVVPPTATPVVLPATPSPSPTIVPPTAAPTVTPTATATHRPTPAATATPVLLGEHVVVPGDTLWDIAGVWYGGPGCYEFCGHLKWPGLFEANRDRIEVPQLIYPNQRLRVPAWP